MFHKLATIGANSLKRRNMGVMVDKVLIRLTSRDSARQAEESRAWCAGVAEELEPWLSALDPALWAETKEACAAIERDARAKLDALGLDLGGGGNYPLLYFMTRFMKPGTVLETGVAAGWSSQAVLRALHRNGVGHLYSSDFPYFRYDNPERYVGYIVDPALKDRWTLKIDGDRNNIPALLAAAGTIDLFHYDSDKSVQGRTFAYECVAPQLSAQALVIFDDIQDNLHFRDFVTARRAPFKVFAFGGKFIGLTGHIPTGE